MARTEIHEVVFANTGSAMLPASGTVTVNYRDTDTEATVYADATGTTEVLNPLTISSNTGRLEGWLEPGSYDLDVVTSQESYTQRYESAPGTGVGNAINPMGYGAVGDGVTDDRAAIQAAVAALPASGGEILVPNHTFACDFSTPLSLGNRTVTFRGEGPASKLMSLNESTTAHIKGFALSLFDSLTLKNLTVQGPAALGAAGKFDPVFIDTGFCTVKVDNCAFTRFSRCFHIDPTANWVGTLDVQRSTITGYASTGDLASSYVLGTTAGTGTRNKRINIRNCSLSGCGNTGSAATHGIDVSGDYDLNIEGNDFVSSTGIGYVIQIHDTAVIAANGSADQKIHSNHFAVGLSCSCVGVGGVARPHVYDNSSECSTPLVHVHSGTPDVTVNDNMIQGPVGLGAVNISVAGKMRVHDNHFHSSAAGATAQIFAVTTPAARLLIHDNDFSQASGEAVLLSATPTVYNEWGNYGSAITDGLKTAASAPALVLPAVTANNVVSVTGVDGIESIDLRPAGTRLTLVFEDVLTVVDAATLVLAGDFVTSANDTLDLVSTGTAWVETGPERQLMTVVVTGGGAGGSASCTFGELLTEFYARGFDYLNQDEAGRDRAKRWLNEAYVEDVCDIEPWPFLETVATGPAPLTISNVRDVLYVTDTANETRIPSADIRDIIDQDTDTARTGNPSVYYWDGLATLRTYPVSTAALTMRYIAVPTELETDSDTLVLPRRFCPLVIEGAVVRAYMDSDNYEAAASVQQMFDRRMAKMTDAMFSRNLDNTQFVLRTSEHDG